MSKEAKSTERALKLALEALENWVEYFPQNIDDIDKKAITSLREELSKPDFWEGYVPEPVKPAQQALGKKAENARELGLDYDPFWGGGPTNKDYEDAMRQRRLHQLTTPPDAFEQLMREADKPTQVLQDGVAEYVDALMNGTHEITSVTIRPKRTWVGLTDEELSEVYNQADWDTVSGWEYERAIEAKLKEKNT